MSKGGSKSGTKNRCKGDAAVQPSYALISTPTNGRRVRSFFSSPALSVCSNDDDEAFPCTQLVAGDIYWDDEASPMNRERLAKQLDEAFSKEECHRRKETSPWIKLKAKNKTIKKYSPLDFESDPTFQSFIRPFQTTDTNSVGQITPQSLPESPCSSRIPLQSASLSPSYPDRSASPALQNDGSLESDDDSSFLAAATLVFDDMSMKPQPKPPDKTDQDSDPFNSSDDDLLLQATQDVLNTVTTAISHISNSNKKPSVSVKAAAVEAAGREAALTRTHSAPHHSSRSRSPSDLGHALTYPPGCSSASSSKVSCTKQEIEQRRQEAIRRRKELAKRREMEQRRLEALHRQQAHRPH